MTSGKSSQQYLLKVFLSELFLNRTFALIRLNGGFGEGFLMRVAAERCALARPRPALENLPRWKPRGSWIRLWGKCAVGWGDRCIRGVAEGALGAGCARTLG